MITSLSIPVPFLPLVTTHFPKFTFKDTEVFGGIHIYFYGLNLLCMSYLSLYFSAAYYSF